MNEIRVDSDGIIKIVGPLGGGQVAAVVDFLDALGIEFEADKIEGNSPARFFGDSFVIEVIKTGIVPKKFTAQWRNPADFFQQLEVGEIFTYSFSSFLFQDVQRIAREHGVEIEYMGPETEAYREHGCTTCRRMK